MKNCSTSLVIACMHDKSLQLCPTPIRLPCPWDSPGKNTAVGCHSLLQRIFPTQGLNLGLLHCKQIIYHVNHQGTRGIGSTPRLVKTPYSFLNPSLM